jgi:hypothetical protein
MKQHLVRISFALLLAVSVTPIAYGAETPAAGSQEQQAQSAEQGWKEEWEKVVAAARKEGAVTIAGPPQAAERSVMQKFQKAYPDIKLEYTGLTNAQFMSRASTERTGGVYTWDIYIGGVSSGYRYVDQGFFQPIRSNLIHPELTDDSIWLGGFDAGFQDNAGKYMYAFTGYITNLIAVNRSVVPESQLNSSKDLLDPKWRGEIVIYDPRAGGAGLLALSALRRRQEAVYRMGSARPLSDRYRRRRCLPGAIPGGRPREGREQPANRAEGHDLRIRQSSHHGSQSASERDQGLRQLAADEGNAG